MHSLLEGFPAIIETPVAWAEMDAFRHVNNTVYFRWFESARIDYLGRIHFQDSAASDGLGPILGSTHCRFRRPIVFPDTVLAAARTTEVREDRFVMEYRVVSTRLGEIAAEGGGVVVSYDYHNNHRAPLPERVREAIARLEG